MWKRILCSSVINYENPNQEWEKTLLLLKKENIDAGHTMT
jgi:hypothetical protein